MLNFFKKNHRVLILGLFLMGFFIVLFLPVFARAADPGFGSGTTPFSFRDQTLSSKLRPGSDIWSYFGPAWEACLALANIVVIVVLAFLAIVNIAHINYDTYTVKKSLPGLIIGIIMANFSLLICRMILDVSNVLTNTFTGGDIVGNLFDPLMQGLGIGELGTGTATTGIIAFFLGPAGVAIGLGLMLLTLIAVILPVIAAFIF